MKHFGVRMVWGYIQGEVLGGRCCAESGGVSVGRPSGNCGYASVVLAAMGACVGYWYVPGAPVFVLLPCEGGMEAWPMIMYMTLGVCECWYVRRAGQFWL